MKFLYCKLLIFYMVLSDQRTPYSIMYVWAAFERKSPPTRQDLVTLINNYTYTLYVLTILKVRQIRNVSLKPTILPKSKRICFLEEFEDTKKSFRN